jgi:hypothetical protein
MNPNLRTGSTERTLLERWRKVLSCTTYCERWGAENFPHRQSSPSLKQRPVKVWHRYTKVRGRFVPLDQRRNLERWTTAASPALSGLWLNVAKTLVEWLSAFYERTRDCWNGVGRETVIHCGDKPRLGFGVEVSERDQNLAINTRRSGLGAHLKLSCRWVQTSFTSTLLKVAVKLYYHRCWETFCDWCTSPAAESEPPQI